MLGEMHLVLFAIRHHSIDIARILAARIDDVVLNVPGQPGRRWARESSGQLVVVVVIDAGRFEVGVVLRLDDGCCMGNGEL